MKPILTALGICALLFASATTFGDAYKWDGAGGDDSWCKSGPNNWDTGGHPGKNADYDTATIEDDTTYDTVEVDCNIPYDVAWVLLDANNADVSLVLQISSNGILSVEDGSNTGYIRLRADSAAVYNATLQYDAGSIDWDKLECLGGPCSSYGCAVVDINASLNVTSGGAEADVYMERYCSVDVARGATWTVNDVVIGNMSGNNACAAISASGASGTGSMSCSSITIEGGSSADTTVTVGSNSNMGTS